MDALAIFGLVAVTAMLMFYALEDHSPWFILAFAGACVLASAYGFMQGAWPFGIIEAIWAGVAVRRWRIRVRVYEYTPFCNGPVDVNCSPIVTPPSSRFCPWSTLRPPHYAVRGSGEPI